MTLALLLQALAAALNDLLVGLGLAVLFVAASALLIRAIARIESNGPERERPAPVEPVELRGAHRVRDRSRRGPVAEDFVGKHKLGRVA